MKRSLKNGNAWSSFYCRCGNAVPMRLLHFNNTPSLRARCLTLEFWNAKWGIRWSGWMPWHPLPLPPEPPLGEPGLRTFENICSTNNCPVQLWTRMLCVQMLRYFFNKTKMLLYVERRGALSRLAASWKLWPSGCQQRSACTQGTGGSSSRRLLALQRKTWDSCATWYAHAASSSGQ